MDTLLYSYSYANERVAGLLLGRKPYSKWILFSTLMLTVDERFVVLCRKPYSKWILFSTSIQEFNGELINREDKS